MHYKILATITFSITLLGCSPPPIRLQYQYAPRAFPETCNQYSELAKQLFRKKWSSQLFNPSETIILENNERGKDGYPAILAPVNSHRILQDEILLTNQWASLFINCGSKEAFVRARGGVIDKVNWYGPFKL